MKKLFTLLMVVMMIVAIAVPAAAEISPKPEPEYNVDVDVSEGEGEANKTPNDDGTVTLEAKPSDGSNFIKWELEGEYEIISGSLTSPVLVIKPLTDVKANAFFEKDGSVVTKPADTTTAPVQKPTPGDKSPQTGTAPIFFAVAMLVAFVGATFAFKKGSARV